MTLEEAMEKARKLLNLAQSDNPNEAAAAAAQAQKILDRYEISRAMMEERGEEEPDDETIEVFAGSPLHETSRFNMDKWRSRLAGAIARHNACKIYLQSSGNTKSIVLVGRPADVEKVRYLFDWMFNETERLCKRDGKGQGRTWRNNYRHGVVDTIEENLADVHDDLVKELKEAATDSTALVRVNNALQKIEQRLERSEARVDQITEGKQDYGSRMTWRGDARKKGQQAGKEINVNSKARGALKS